MNIYDFIELQRKSFLSEFSQHMMSCLIATTKKRLFNNAQQFHWKIEPLQGTQNDSVFITSRTLKDQSHLIPGIWVKASYTNYNLAYRKFLSLYYNCSLIKIPPELQVDHLQARHRFKREHKPYYIRLALIDRTINSSFGAGFEHRFYSKEREKVPSGGFHMDWLSFLKIYGVKPPSSRLSESELSNWCWSLAQRINSDGLADQVEAFYGISLVLNLGFTSSYTPYRLSSQHFLEASQFPFFDCVTLHQA